jgi:thioredoxin 1
MKNAWKIAVVCLVVAAVAGVLVLKKSRVPAPPETPATTGLPRLVDLGSVECIPCKMMAPILEEMKTEYAGRLVVEFIDVNVNRAAATRYGIKLIPTQVFFDASGVEVDRNEGFISKEDILARFEKRGVSLKGIPAN